MTSLPLLDLRIGEVAPLGLRGAPSGIVKLAVAAPLALSETGLSGDRQGDTVRHGGPEKAVHHYPFDHYAAWRSDFGHHALLAGPGAFGENISTVGLTEETAAIGDVFSLGTAVVEVSQGRQPCWKLNERFGRSDMARQVQSTGRTGWYYRVLTPGIVAPEDRLTLLDRRSPDWTLRRIWRAFYIDPLNRTELAGIAALDHLAEGWRGHAARRLESNRVEDWTRRLDSPRG
ncbi:MAG TPA: MOSC domain-containing protein [Mesorhizobium sp.]|jgi:MOSC domain-containing protein YiiM|uniref:MOSC domain-containing protein n=1 Tax=Mesorhizobium sp. TaxID=1871066 RepID=UPI002DDC9567|nr:MOSC domain-containing protein [Mesorhizobium sp.]HEV2504172.1 MOSC domain-containing protein [Mesorhizobium sp.]